MNPIEQTFCDVMRLGLYLCTSGTCEITVNDKTFHINPGDAFLRSPLLIVSGINMNHDFAFETIIEDEIEVFAPIASKHFEILKNLLANQVYHLSLNAHEQASLLSDKQQIELHKNIYTELSPTSKRFSLHATIIPMLEQMVVLKYADMYLSRNEGVVLEPHKEQSIMIRFVFLLFKNYKEHREVGYYTNALNFSAGHFTTLIRKISRRTPSEWIAIVTINHAKRLLRMGNMSIKEVASELGFPEQFTFCKYFKRHTGLSPKAFAAKKT